MIKQCAVCRKQFDVLWPELWTYKRGAKYLCSWKCLRLFDEKGSKKMYKTVKKDGTPAKKPGKKTAAKALEELKEDFAEKGVGLVYDPGIAEEYKREQDGKIGRSAEILEKQKKKEEEAKGSLEYGPPEIWQTAAIRNEKLGEFYYDMKYRTIDWRHPSGDEISLPPEDFAALADMIPQILHVLGVDV